MKARLYQKYVNEVVPALKEKHKYNNVHQIPRILAFDPATGEVTAAESAKRLRQWRGPCTRRDHERSRAEARSARADQGVDARATAHVLIELLRRARAEGVHSVNALRNSRAKRGRGAETRLTVVGTAFAGNAFSGLVGKGQAVRIMTGAVMPPVYLTSTFESGNPDGFDYTRSGNPNFRLLEQSAATLEGADRAGRLPRTHPHRQSDARAGRNWPGPCPALLRQSQATGNR